MEFNLADLSRRLENVIRFGTIAEVKHSRIPRVRVKLGDIITNWLRVVAARAGAGICQRCCRVNLFQTAICACLASLCGFRTTGAPASSGLFRLGTFGAETRFS